MGRRSVFFDIVPALAIFGAALLGCDGAKAPVLPPSMCNPPAEIDIPIIGLSKTATCPEAASAKGGRWVASPVFPQESGERLPPEMARLCAYTWDGCGAPDPAAIPLDGLVYAAADPPIVEPLAPAETERKDTVAAARTRLARAADASTSMSVGDKTTPVFIGLPDTSPASPDGTFDIPLDAASHGFDIAWIARFLACPSGSKEACFARVRTDLALGRPGGRGARSDLASSVVRLVRVWKKKDGRKAPLLIPIAAGWEPLAESALPWKKGPVESEAEANDKGALPLPKAPFGGAGAALSPGARAALYALHYAACHGALVVAASGSDPGYKTAPTGPMLPAAWETLQAPSADACKAWFGDDAVRGLAVAQTPYTPLVHGVAGVDERDHPIVGTRLGSIPRLVAPAALGAAYPEDPADSGYARFCAPGESVASAFVCDKTTPRTGTSVAAAVTSAIAAVVWAHHPSWSGHDVMAALYSGGMSLGETPDILLTGTGKETVARISLCGALSASCQGAPKEECPARLTCTRPPAFARGPHPSPFVAKHIGFIPLTVHGSGMAVDSALVCPGCVLHKKASQSGGCELQGEVPEALFGTRRVGQIKEPSLDLIDGFGRRLGYVETQGFRPQSWTASDSGNQPVYASAASCNGAAQAVLRYTLCFDAACSKTVPGVREVPIVE